MRLRAHFLFKNVTILFLLTWRNVLDQYVNIVHYIYLITLIYKHQNLIKAAMIMAIDYQ